MAVVEEKGVVVGIYQTFHRQNLPSAVEDNRAPYARTGGRAHWEDGETI